MASKKTRKTVDTKTVITEAVEHLKQNKVIEDFDENQISIMEILQGAAKKEELLSKKISHMKDEPSVQDIEREMSTIIGHDRVTMIKNVFSIETYRMKLVKEPNGQWIVQFRRGEAEFRPDLNLVTTDDVDVAVVFQWASVVVEIFMFVLSAVGIHTDISASKMREISTEVEGIVRQPAFMRALNEFKDSWEHGSVFERAKAMFDLLKKSYSLGFFWKITNLLLHTLSIWGRIKAVAECTAMLVAAFATDGAALIARLVLSLDSAVTLVQKLINIKHFAELRKTLE